MIANLLSLLLLPLVILIASCSRYSEVKIKSVCSRYFVAEYESTYKREIWEKNQIIYDEKLSLLKEKYPLEKGKNFNLMSQENFDELDKLLNEKYVFFDEWQNAVAERHDIYATLLKIQGFKNVDYYRQFISRGKKMPKTRYGWIPEYESTWWTLDDFQRKEKKNIDKAIELFKNDISIARSFCSSYGVERRY